MKCFKLFLSKMLKAVIECLSNKRSIFKSVFLIVIKMFHKIYSHRFNVDFNTRKSRPIKHFFEKYMTRTFYKYQRFIHLL